MSIVFKTISDVTVENCILRVIQEEGGYVNDPHDAGGETNYGITKATANAHKSLWAKHRWNGDMRTLPMSLAYDIYHLSYWRKAYCDDLYRVHPLLAYHIFDLAVNGGVKRPIIHLQETLNSLNNQGKLYKDISVDGAIGPTTIEMLKTYVRLRGKEGVKVLIEVLLSEQTSFYKDLTERKQTQETFAFGWYKRVWSKRSEFVPILNAW